VPSTQLAGNGEDAGKRVGITSSHAHLRLQSYHGLSSCRRNRKVGSPKILNVGFYWDAFPAWEAGIVSVRFIYGARCGCTSHHGRRVIHEERGRQNIFLYYYGNADSAPLHELARRNPGLLYCCSVDTLIAENAARPESALIVAWIPMKSFVKGFLRQGR